VIAWLLMVPAGVGAMSNIYSFAASVSPYPRWVWAALFLVKCGMFVAGLLLLSMRRMAVWIYVIAAIAGWTLSLVVTSSYTPVATWQYAVGVLLMVIYAFFVFRHWDTLSPRRRSPLRGTESLEAAE
jgi:hypothetical protein